MANGPFYEPGLHLGQIVAQGLTKTKTGNPQFVFKAKVLGVPNMDGQGYLPHAQQYERSIYMVLTEKTVDFVTDNLERLGFPRDASLATLDPNHPQAHRMVGQQVELWCRHEKDLNGDLRERWGVSTGGATAIAGDALDQREMRQLDALFGRSASAVTTAKTMPKSSSEDDLMITDDDIPF